MINWTEQSEGDYIAIEGDYMLRVEQMDELQWWWCVYFKDDEVDSGNTTKVLSAKLRAILGMRNHARRLLGYYD